MIRSIIGPFWTRSSKFPLSSTVSSFRSLHQETKILKLHRHYKSLSQQRRGKKDEAKQSTLFKPVPVQAHPDDIDIGAELTGKLDKGELLKILNKFTQRPEIKMLCLEHGLDG